MAGNTSSERLFCLIVIAAFLPPAAVGIDYGCSSELCVNILFSLIPLAGFIHAIYLLLKKRDRAVDEEHGNDPSYSFPQNGQAQQQGETPKQQGETPQQQVEKSQQQVETSQQQGQAPQQQVESSQLAQAHGQPNQEPQDVKSLEQSYEQAPEKFEESVPEYQPPSHSPPEAYSKMQQQ